MKTHLHDSDVPAIEGAKLLAICGAIVPDSVFVAQSDDGASAESVVQSCSCYRCQKQASRLTLKYLYLAVAGEEAKQA